MQIYAKLLWQQMYPRMRSEMRVKYIFFGKILQQYERMWMILLCISRKMVLLMLVYVCQHADVIGDACISVSTQRILVMFLYVCQHADDIGDDCMSVSTQRILVMLR
jgi:hypothetical protein